MRLRFSVASLALGLVASLPVAAATPNQHAADTAILHLQAQRGRMGLPAATDFQSGAVMGDHLGQTHVRAQQLYNGVKVFGGEAIVHMKGDTVLSVTDDMRRGIQLDTNPRLAGSDAVAIAHNSLAPLGSYNVEPTSDLVIFRDDNGRFALAYHVHAELENNFETRHADFMVDARSGRILDSWNSLETSASTATGNSQYSGTVTLNTNSISGGYELRDTTRSNNFTTNLNHATSGNGAIYTDADTNWGDGANYVEGSSTTAANGETAAVDAHFGMAKTWDYYAVIHSRNGIDGAGATTFSRVHYSNSYDNAFWSDSCFCMTYGDGSSFKTLTAIDVAGHEMTHGVTSRTAGLVYRRESGGLNESISDIMGTNVEFWGTTHGDWTIGEQLRATPLRYMYNPSLDGHSANCWSKQVGSLDVHYSSGVGNHFYYLLSQGSNVSPASPTCNGSTITGVGRTVAERIIYRALNVYMTSNTNYAGARAACLSAAADLYGSGSTQYNAVAAAWSAVNVN